MPGKSIRLYLVDGIPTGVRTVEMGLSTIKAVVIPRLSLSKAGGRAELNRTGVYFLYGPDPKSHGLSRIYVGEGDVVLSRLVSHSKDPKKDFWEVAVVFVSKDENLTKAHGRYLEARFIDLAIKAKRCTLENGTEPDQRGRLPEADSDEMEQFIDQARTLLGILGMDVFEPQKFQPQVETESAHNELVPVFSFAGNGFDGKCELVPDSGVVILKKGSIARAKEAKALPDWAKSKRKMLFESGIFSRKDDGYELLQDYSFDSPSTAAQILSGQNINGRIAWKTLDGKTLGKWEEGTVEGKKEGSGTV